MTDLEQAILKGGAPQEIAVALNCPIKSVYYAQRKLRATGCLPGEEKRRAILLRWFRKNDGCVKDAAASLGWDYNRTTWLANGLIREGKLTDKIFQKGRTTKYPGLVDGIIRLSKEGLYTPKEFYEALDRAFPLCAVKGCVGNLRSRGRIRKRPRIEIDDELIRLSEKGLNTTEEYYEALGKSSFVIVKRRLNELRKQGRIPKYLKGAKPKYRLDDEIIRLSKERRITARVIVDAFGVSEGWAEKRLAKLRREGRLQTLHDSVVEYIKLNPGKSYREACADFGCSFYTLKRSLKDIDASDVCAAINASDKNGRELLEELANRFQCLQEDALRAAQKLDLKTYCRLIETTEEEEDAVLAQAEQTAMDVDVARLAPLANLTSRRIADIRRVVAWKHGYSKVETFFRDYVDDVYAERNQCDPPQEYVEAMTKVGLEGARMTQETFDRYYELFRQKEIRARAGKSTVILNSRRNHVSIES